MSKTAWILTGIAIAFSIAFPVKLIAIPKLKSIGAQSAPDEWGR